MDAKGREGLCCALAEADIAQLLGLGDVQDIMYGVRDIVPCKIVYTENRKSVWKITKIQCHLYHT